MPSATLDGVRIHYETYGGGFPLILCYCRGGNTTQWRPQIPEFSKRYQLILWDPRGHAKSESPKDPTAYGLDVSAQDLLGLMDYLKLPKAYVGGLSMGGGISTRFALAHPQRVEALLIIDSGSAAGRPGPPERGGTQEKMNELALTQGMEAAARYAIEANLDFGGRAKRGPEAVKGILEMFMALDPVGYVKAMQAANKASPISHRLHEINVPTLVLAGEEDPAVPDARFTHQQIKGSKLVLVPNAGHFSNQDQPEAFNREVLAFLSQVEARRKTPVG
jgi:pimeloyl-ACP methyl ester carboxylesterase